MAGEIMPQRRPWRKFALAVVALAVVGFVAHTLLGGEGKAVPAVHAAAVPVRVVRVVRAQRGDLDL